MDRSLIQIIGGAIVLVALADVFLTVLHPRAGAAILSPRLNRLLWVTIREVSRIRWGRGRESIRAYAGPLALALTVALWLMLIMLGFALIAWPELGHDIRGTNGVTQTDFLTALYYSGSALTTVGLGDFIPHTTAARMAFLVESLIGLSLVTLAITYFLSIYSALNQRNAFASELHYMTARTGDAAELLVRIGSGGRFDSGARAGLAQVARELLNILQAHHAYPITHLFHQADNDIAPARVALVALDTASLVRSALDPDTHREFLKCAAVETLWDGGLKLLIETSRDILTEADRHGTDHPRAGEWRERFLDAREKLTLWGFDVDPDVERSVAAYGRQRRRWDDRVRAFATYRGQQWSEIDHHSAGRTVASRAAFPAQ